MSEDDRLDLPPASAPNFNERVREVLSTYLGRRGDKLNRGVTLRDLVESNIIKLRAGFLSGSGGTPVDGAGSAVAGTGSAVTSVYEADLTPPPTPTGFTVTAGLTSLMVSCDAQVYTQGHRHSKSVLYGASWISGPAKVFSDAVVLTEFSGAVASHATNLGTTWHLWLKWVSVDGVSSTSPAGGTNGVTVATGKIGNVDLLPLIIDAGKLALGAVDATKFAITIEPVTLVPSAPLPTLKSTTTIFYGPDSKLYRWSGTAYVSSVPAGDLTGQLSDAQLSAISAAKLTGQIVASQITDSAITAAKISAGAITAGKIAAGAIVAGDIAAGAITTAKLAAGAVTANEISANAITAGAIAAGAITAGKIAANAIAVGSAAIENGAITNALIGNLAVDDAKITSLTVTKLDAGSLKVGAFISSSNYIAGSQGFRINADGLAEFSNVVVRGTVYASAGTFAGSLSAATGTFAGSLSAATGTFTGSISAASGDFRGQITGGSFTGYAWPAAGQTGFFLGSSGLMLGNYNDNRYFQVSASGNVSSPGFHINNGVLTIDQVNVINTLNIAGNAVTIPVGAHTAGSMPPPGTIQSVSISSSGAPIQILAGFTARSGGVGVTNSGDVSLLRNGAALVTIPFSVSDNSVGSTETGFLITPQSVSVVFPPILDQPGSGFVTYTMSVTPTPGQQVTGTVASRGITLLEVKR